LTKFSITVAVSGGQADNVTNNLPTFNSTTSTEVQETVDFISPGKLSKLHTCAPVSKIKINL
jgi:hypothetical protein